MVKRRYKHQSYLQSVENGHSYRDKESIMYAYKEPTSRLKHKYTKEEISNIYLRSNDREITNQVRGGGGAMRLPRITNNRSELSQ